MFETEREELKKKKRGLEKELRTLYAILNATAMVEPSEEELAREQEIEQLQLELDAIRQRQDAIGGPGYNRYCPCCGMKIPNKYLRQIEEEKEQKQARLNELLEDDKDIFHEREGNPVAEIIEEKEKMLREVDDVLRELGDIAWRTATFGETDTRDE